MNSRWSDLDLEQLVGQLGPDCPLEVAHRVYSARLLGADASLVLHGGGNVSVKSTYTTVLGETVDALFVKASGRDMATLDAGDLCPVDLGRIRRLPDLSDLDDDTLARAMRLCLLDATAMTPSIEAPLHALLPHKFVDHSHADALVALSHRADGPEQTRTALGDRVAIVPYLRPGPALARAAADAFDENQGVEGIVLLRHGLVTFGDDARTSYERHMSLIADVESYLAKRRRPPVAVSFRTDQRPEELAAKVAPVLRGALAVKANNADQPFSRSVLHWRGGSGLLDIINSQDAAVLAVSGPLTGDHVIRTKSRYLFVDSPDWKDPDRLRGQVVEAMSRFRQEHDVLACEHGDGDATGSTPDVIMVPGAGLFARGRTIEDARIAANIAERTLMTKAETTGLGPFLGLEPEHLRDMAQRSLQRAKLASCASGPLAGQIVFVSGGAGAIGSAIGVECAVAGAHVALTDINERQLAEVVSRINDRVKADRAFGVVADVTDEQAVQRAYETVCLRFGGVDVIVPNAGIAHVSTIEDMNTADFERVMAVNTTGYLVFMREGIRVLKSQATGGNIVMSASKNVFGPGRSFGAYSASKAAGHQLGKVAAMELAEHGIRVNMINADAVFGDAELESGLWATVGPERAAARGMSTAELPEFYRSRNLLKARVTGRHVGRAVVFFASNATPTTGATLPVDGGVVEAFPR